jgi:hypothetical protein
MTLPQQQGSGLLSLNQTSVQQMAAAAASSCSHAKGILLLPCDKRRAYVPPCSDWHMSPQLLSKSCRLCIGYAHSVTDVHMQVCIGHMGPDRCYRSRHQV